MDAKAAPASGYWLPHDSEEDRRLKLQHDALKYYVGGNLAPRVREALPSGPLNFIDIAGGSGIWAAEIASEYPDSEVISMDIGEYSSRSFKSPSNCRFLKGDMTKALPFESNQFDCVQVRISPTVRDRVSFYQEAHRILKPGGFLQLVDLINYTSEIDDPPKCFLDMDRAVSGMCKYPPSTFKQETWLLDPTIDSELEEALDLKSGKKLWEGVTRDKVVTPITGWPSDPRERELGLGQAEAVQMLWKAFAPAVLEDNIMKQDDIDAIAEGLRRELDVQPPLKLGWGYNVRVARKGVWEK